MSQPIDGDRFQARIAEDHLVGTLARRVAVECGLHIGRQDGSQVGQRLQERDGHRLALRLVVHFLQFATGRRAGYTIVVLECARDLTRQLVVQPVDEIANVIGDVADVQAFATAITREDDVGEVLDRGNDFLVLRQRAMAQMADLRMPRVGANNAIGQFGQLFFQSEIGRAHV